MAWVAVDFDGKEYIYASEPTRSEECRCWQVDSWKTSLDIVELQNGSIKKLIGKELSFTDEPVELKEE